MICSVLKRATTKYYLIQSFSDVVTNSSSEIFCTITGNDLDSIYELLKPLFPSSYGYSDMEPTLYMVLLPYGFPMVSNL